MRGEEEEEEEEEEEVGEKGRFERGTSVGASSLSFSKSSFQKSVLSVEEWRGESSFCSAVAVGEHGGVCVQIEDVDNKGDHN